jgi:hypothetical protein
MASTQSGEAVMLNERRVKRVRVSQRVLLELFQPIGQCVCLRLKHPLLPSDAKVVAVNIDFDSRSFVAIVASAEFDDVSECSVIPLLDEENAADYEARYVDGDRLTDWRPSLAQADWGVSPLAAALPAWKKQRDIDDNGIATRDIAKNELVTVSADGVNAIMSHRPVQAGDIVETPIGGIMVSIPAAVVNAEDQTGYSDVKAQVEFFRKSILAD